MFEPQDYRSVTSYKLVSWQVKHGNLRGVEIFSPVERSGAITGYNPTYKYFLGPIFCIRSPFIFFWGKEVLPTDMVKHLKYWFRFFNFQLASMKSFRDSHSWPTWANQTCPEKLPSHQWTVSQHIFNWPVHLPAMNEHHENASVFFRVFLKKMEGFLPSGETIETSSGGFLIY